ncbi:hypothetical protein NP233_g3042 [Leucocoprinus birnbaumii]|uniref:Uncharacterized protein n=1 Tax=Leucocoprinus birnbaumii TaxID=56174 RepID=A0AAD5YT61_9AGAR|nr:hypothetical protein NP233_g3042 [Leucocoprinus birnbaumii]
MSHIKPVCDEFNLAFSCYLLWIAARSNKKGSTSKSQTSNSSRCSSRGALTLNSTMSGSLMYEGERLYAYDQFGYHDDDSSDESSGGYTDESDLLDSDDASTIKDWARSVAESPPEPHTLA